MKPESTAHTKKSSARDEGIMLTDQRLLKPFNCNLPHEPYPSFTEIRKSIREKLSINDLFQWLTKHKRWLAQGLGPENEEPESSDED